MEEEGYSFESDTDTEVFITFIEDIQKTLGVSLEEAVRVALTKVVGAYAIVIMSQDDPDKLIAARKGSPLVIGLGKGEYYVASDATPIIEFTNEVVYLNDAEIAVITRAGIEIVNTKDIPQKPYIHTLDLQLEAIAKGGYEHFMPKECVDPPMSILD